MSFGATAAWASAVICSYSSLSNWQFLCVRSKTPRIEFSKKSNVKLITMRGVVDRRDSNPEAPLFIRSRARQFARPISAIGFTAPIARVRPVRSHSLVVAHSTLVIRVACPRPFFSVAVKLAANLLAVGDEFAPPAKNLQRQPFPLVYVNCPVIAFAMSLQQFRSRCRSRRHSRRHSRSRSRSRRRLA